MIDKTEDVEVDKKLQEYQEEKEKTEEYYKTINKIKCPFFNDYIIFNADGLHHIIYKNKGERNKNEQITRFKLLNKAKELIEKTSTHQEFLETFKIIKKKKRKKIVNENTKIKFWGFTAIIDNKRIKVVIRQIGNGNKHFFSVIPAWKTKYYQENKIIENFENNFDVDE